MMAKNLKEKAEHHRKLALLSVVKPVLFVTSTAVVDLYQPKKRSKCAVGLPFL